MLCNLVASALDFLDISTRLLLPVLLLFLLMLGDCSFIRDSIFYVWFYQFFYQFFPIIIVNNTFNNIFRFFFFFSVLLFAIEVLLFPLAGCLVIYAFVSAFFSSGHHIMVCINLVPCFIPVWNSGNKSFFCSPIEVGGLGHFHRQFDDQLKRPGPHNFGKQALSSLIICFFSVKWRNP